MEQQEICALAEQILRGVFVELEASGRHVHLTHQQALDLFGHPLTPKRPLSQPGQYLANERLTLVGPKGKLEHVAVLGPERKEAQVEISLTDARHLGLEAPVRLSGDVQGTPGIILLSDRSRISLRQGVLIAQRHIHLTPEDAKRFGVSNGQLVKLKTYTSRPVIFEDVAVRVSRDFAGFVHLDFDEANACGFRPGDLGRILP